MDNTSNEAWDKAQLAQWAEFWNSELGQDYLKQLNDMKTSLLDSAVTQDTAEKVMGMAGRAAGVGLVITSIQTGIVAAKQAKEREEAAARK